MPCNHANCTLSQKELAELRSKHELREKNWHKEEQELQRIVEELNEELAEVGQRLDRSEHEKSQLEAQLGEVCLKYAIKWKFHQKGEAEE